MDTSVTYGTAGCFIGTILSMLIIKYNPNPFILVILPMWGLVMGIAVAKVMDIKSKKAR
jgi:ascorbate-specific PTS system EIIC-type component UlaA